MKRPARRGAILLISVCTIAVGMSGASAQPAAAPAALNAKELSGMALFNQHCRVCHTKPLLTSGQYGPVLSKSSLGGDDKAMHDFIANGTQRMPGFKYSFAPAQIDEIVAYLKTVPAPDASPTSP
jgi:mono/diheme cytochrome c family protein